MNCILVQRKLRGSVCPLHKGACFYQHRDTHVCRSNLSNTKDVNKLAAGVGLPVPTPEQIRDTMQSIQESVQQGMKE